MDRQEWHRRNRAAAAKQAESERKPQPAWIRSGRGGINPSRKSAAGPPENKDMGGPPEDKDAGAVLFASSNAEELAGDLGIALPPGGGSGKDGRYTVADVKKAAEGE